MTVKSGELVLDLDCVVVVECGTVVECGVVVECVVVVVECGVMVEWCVVVECDAMVECGMVVDTLVVIVVVCVSMTGDSGDVATFEICTGLIAVSSGPDSEAEVGGLVPSVVGGKEASVVTATDGPGTTGGCGVRPLGDTRCVLSLSLDPRGVVRSPGTTGFIVGLLSPGFRVILSSTEYVVTIPALEDIAVGVVLCTKTVGVVV